MFDAIRFLLLQVRNAGDPMAEHEVSCFARALGCSEAQIGVFDLLSGRPEPGELEAVDVVLLGGSGDYSVAKGGPWLEPALDAMRDLYRMRKPTFASCWGFQAMARALGGVVVNDLTRAEVGTYELSLTPAGLSDPVFGALGPTFHAQNGHMDVVDRLPEDAVLLASSDRTRNHAYRFKGRPIYCTQFHPELDLQTLLDRLRAYPDYLRNITGLDYETFVKSCREAPATRKLLPRFVEQALG